MRFEPNPNFEEEFERDPEYRQAITRVNHRVASSIRRASPSEDLTKTIEAGELSVYTTSSFWHIIEYGSVNNSPYAPFRRGVLDTGLRFDHAPKP